MHNHANWRSSANLFRRFIPLAVLAVLSLAALLYAGHALWSLIILLPLLGIALWDSFQQKHTLRRNYPLIARFRWMMEDLRPFLRSYIVESDLEGRPFNHDERALIYARAKGELDSHPFGTELDVYSDEYEWLNHSIKPKEDLPKEWRAKVGSTQCTKPYNASLLNISAMSFGALSANAIMALNKGAKIGNFYHDTGEGGLSRYHKSHGGDLVWELGSGYFGCRTDDGQFCPDRFQETAQNDQVRMIEIKLSQGAKPGHGGMLPGSKVTQEIADARQVPKGKDCVSPAGHSAFGTPIEMVEWAARLRDLSGGKPVGIKLCVGQPHEVFAVMKAMLETGIRLDFITVDGAEGGTGAAPVELSNRVGLPLREGVIMVRNALIGCDLKDEVKIAASGKVHSGADMAMQMGLGADWCNAARAFMFALGCVQSMRCHTDTCPTGIATQDMTRQRGLVVEDKASRVARYQKETLRGLHQIVVAMGLDTPWEIKPTHIGQRWNTVRSDSIDQFYEFLTRGALLKDADSTQYSRHWKAAQAASFRPVIP
ncbi:FMN-binding glutamate synthase family protein [Altericroceibacterium spongiae]|uniref:FMN-binding glutamate synthase family protein n=1 Tax=Altericroceibacterium spongiae TaxID=2320269 RepID=A0A420EEE4_9SPHN|nr:FMN-binding glutamate synthase family protein [Altericroceibacterium spongiae]RKF19053.1 FMN-binding glutamate synthase family protein [Altericroceibacterium spongiae]